MLLLELVLNYWVFRVFFNMVTIKGPIAVGDNTSIGANSWLQEDVPANTVVFIQEHPTQLKKPKRSPTPEQMASALKDGK